MNKLFTPEQSDLRRVVRRYCESRFDQDSLRRIIESPDGLEDATWRQMADELGLCAITIPEAFGGAGFTAVELTIVMEELGRALSPVPYLSSVVMGANVLLESKDREIAPRLLGGIARGDSRVAVAVLEPSPASGEAGIETCASPDGGRWLLNGTKVNVVDGHTADTLLVLARTDEGTAFFAVEADTEGVAATRVETLDLTRLQARLTFEGASAHLLGSLGSGWTTWMNVAPVLSLAIAAESVVGALRMLELSAEYAQTRIQFGKAIGSFQAIKQKLADMLVDVELARAATHRAAHEAAANGPRLAFEAAITHALATEIFTSVAYDAIQVHGGIGFTWEHPAHLYFRRAKSNELLFGSPSHHRELAAQWLNI